MAKRRRAQAEEPEGAVGTLRYDLYVKANERIVEAIDAGYFLEAICLVESFVSDRLESRVSYLSGSDFGFQTLGRLIQESRRTEDDEVLVDELLPALDDWRRRRNTAAHELVKIEACDGKRESWSERLARCRTVAVDGHALMKRIGVRINELRG